MAELNVALSLWGRPAGAACTACQAVSTLSEGTMKARFMTGSQDRSLEDCLSWQAGT